MRKNHINGKRLACEIVAFINSNPFAQVKINAKMLCKEKKKWQLLILLRYWVL